jgi:hypothetical protein
MQTEVRCGCSLAVDPERLGSWKVSNGKTEERYQFRNHGEESCFSSKPIAVLTAITTETLLTISTHINRERLAVGAPLGLRDSAPHLINFERVIGEFSPC